MPLAVCSTLRQMIIFAPVSDTVKIDNFCDVLQTFATNFVTLSRL